MTGRQNFGEKIIALFPAVDSATRAIVELKRLGIRDHDIHLALANPQRLRDVGSLIGPQAAAGPPRGLAGIPADIGAGQHLVSALEELGFAAETARVYADRVAAGKVLLAISCAGQAARVRAAIDKHGAFDARTTSARAAAYCQSVPAAGRRLVEEHWPR